MGGSTLKDAIYEGTDVGHARGLERQRLHATTPVVPEWRNIRPASFGLCRRAATPKAFVVFQNDVTVKDLTVAHQEGYASSEHLKRYTTLGMGTDQEEPATSNALAIMAALRRWRYPKWAPQPLSTFYPPVAIGLSPAERLGRHFRPAALTAARWHVAHAGKLIEAGPCCAPGGIGWGERLWRTPTWKRCVWSRSAVGLSDVSTLGKIDVQGRTQRNSQPIYVNGFAKLPVGKARLWGHADGRRRGAR